MNHRMTRALSRQQPKIRKIIGSTQLAHNAIANELNELATDPIANLRVSYKSLFSQDPPEPFGPDLLRRCISFRIQEKSYGGLSQQAQRLLHQSIGSTSTKLTGPLELPRRIKSGSELVRVWKGKTYRVTVMQDGFAYDDKSYASLSEIASLITGTNWNGPRFFGLRAKAKGATAYGK